MKFRIGLRQLYWRAVNHVLGPRTDGAQAVVEHLTECHPVDAVIVIDGNGDAEIAEMLAAGWTWIEGAQTEYVAGKRIRYLTPPGGSLTITTEKEERS